MVNRAQDAAALVGVSERSTLGRKRKAPLKDSNVPVEICMYLLSYSNYLVKTGLIPAPIFATLANNLTGLQDALSNLERIRSTPLPFAYQAHLRMSLWLYLFFLPFQVVKNFNWMVIPGTAFASFLLLGFLEIGQEIEDPFGYDHNDLDLDGFCLSIQRELNEITVHDSPHPLDWMFTQWNQPFAPADRRSAADLVQSEDYSHTHQGVDAGVDSIKRTLLKSWKDIEHKTRNVHY
jgi:predicted membrane chloride channel (bestrophin family)